MTFADDAGEYSVFAKNPLGEASASAILLDEGTSVSGYHPHLYVYWTSLSLHFSSQSNMKPT